MPYYWKMFNVINSYGPLDIGSPGSFILPTILNSPHFIAATTLMILIFLISFLAIENNNVKYSLTSGLLLLILLQFHPYHFITIISVLSVYSLFHLIKNKNTVFYYLKHLAIISIIALPSIIYHALIIINNPVILGRAMQNICITPKITFTIISYGFLLIGAILCSIKYIKNKNLKNINIFLMTWFIIQFILIYMPITFQRRLIQGLNIPMTILTVMFIFYLFDKMKNKNEITDLLIFKNKTTQIILFICLFCISNIYITTNHFLIGHNDFLKDWYYIENNKIEAMKWLKENTDEESIVFSDMLNGNIIPGITARTVFLGHVHETNDFKRKYKEAVWFFSTNKNDSLEQKFLKINNISHIFYSNSEKKIGDWIPENKKYLKKVFENKKVKIYQVL